MEPKKKVIYSYYAVCTGGAVKIYRTSSGLTKVVTSLRVPKLATSPSRTPEGLANNGTVIQDVKYKGGKVVLTLDRYTTAHVLGIYTADGSVTKLDLKARRKVRELIKQNNGVTDNE